MLFAANANEFDRSGIPKYGADLSDDEDYDTTTNSHSVKNLARNTVAWDPELDIEKSDDD